MNDRWIGRSARRCECGLAAKTNIEQGTARSTSASLDDALRVAKNFGVSDHRRAGKAIQMKRRLLLSTIAVVLLFNILLGVRFYTAHAAGGDDDSGYAQISVFAKAVQLLRQDYVDGNKTSYHDLIYAAMKGMLASLDPHSQFMDPNDFKDMQDDTRSRFNGLGIEVAVKGG
ncbi:MAG: carboxyl-terminal processing protease, partial [Acidimicrobiaceae bacterium]|nr:carboxyl-terminal processing protease [Acidimicrobiaceae bacterium]